MNILGLNITLSKNSKYVKQGECHKAMDSINQRIEDLRSEMNNRFDDLNLRIDDLKDFIFKNGKRI